MSNHVLVMESDVRVEHWKQQQADRNTPELVAESDVRLEV